MTTLFLIRHAENSYIEKGRLAGWLPGIHLNPDGQAQAEALAEVLRPVHLRAICSSPLERAMETAQPLAAAKRLEVQAFEPLLEVDFGRWAGQSLRLLRRRKLWRIVQSAPGRMRFPEGESFVEAQARAVRGIETLAERYRGLRSAVACFSHSDIIKLIVCHYLGMPIDSFQRLSVDPASISVLQLYPAGARLLVLNDRRATQASQQG
jgi:probable phosphomutase (TIGR03848 family)